MREPELAVVFSPRDWANRVVRYVTDHGGGRVRLRVIDGRVALEEQFDLLIAEDITSFLDARFVQELRRRGRLILGVYDPSEPAGKEGLLKLGVADVIEHTAPSEDFVRKITALVAESGREGQDSLRGSEVEGLLPGERAGPGREHDGFVTVVGGPPGGCGATELSIQLARGARQSGESCVLVDADDMAPSLAQRLGLPLIPNIRSAVDALFHNAGRLQDVLVLVGRVGFDVMVGMASAADWSHLRPAEVAEVIGELASLRDHVVVNVGSQLEDLASAGGPDRFGLARAMVGSADSIVGVGLATPLGVTRLLAWVAEVRALAPGSPIHLAVNQAADSSFERGELAEEIRRVFIPNTLHFLPFDQKVRKAGWRGEVVAPGPYTKAVDRAARAILPGTPARPVPQARSRARFA